MALNGRGRVLIADADGDFRLKLYKRLLDGDVFSDIVGDAREAIDRLTRNDYGLIVLDLMLPQLGGERVLEAVNDQPRERRPVVLVIAPAGAARSLDVEVVQIVLRRPCDIRQLSDMVRSCIQIATATAGAAPATRGAARPDDEAIA